MKRSILLALLALTVCLAARAMAGEIRETHSFLIQLSGQAPADLADQVAAAGGVLTRVHPDIGYAAAVSLDPEFPAKLQRSSVVVAVDRDLMVQWAPRLEFQQVIDGPEAAGLQSTKPTAASFYGCQWNVRQIDAPGAWAKQQYGAPGVKVAVLDTGIDPFHIDLAGKVDGNSATMLSPGVSPCGAFDEGTIYDLGGHGSFVAALISSNNIGVASVAPLAEVVGVKVLNCDGDGTFEDVIAGILYAANLPDVDVLNISISGGFPKSLRGAAPLIAAMTKAVNYAVSQGKLVVSAAGNAGVDMDHDANYVWVPAQTGAGIAAYATARDQSLASYSNHGVSGTWVGAPSGTSPNTFGPLAGCRFSSAYHSLVFSVCSSFVCSGTKFYTVNTGTSFSAPLVAGVAALVDGKHGGLLTAEDLAAILAESAEDLGKTGTDNIYSHGRVNASRAVDH